MCPVSLYSDLHSVMTPPPLNQCTTSVTNWSFEKERTVTKATPGNSIFSSALASCQRPRRATQRSVRLDDSLSTAPVRQPGRQLGVANWRELRTSTPISPNPIQGAVGSPDDLMQQIVEITRQQSETARCQTELLEHVLLQSTPMASAKSSRASSRHQTPRTQILKSGESECAL